MKKLLSLTKNFILWFLIIFFSLLVIGFWPSIASFVFLLVIILIIPVKKWQFFLSRFIKGKIKGLLSTLLVFVALFTVPTNDNITNQLPVESIAATTDATEMHITETEPTEIITTPTTETISETTAPPTTEVTTIPTTEAYIEPSIEATTEPTVAAVPIEETKETVAQPTINHVMPFSGGIGSSSEEKQDNNATEKQNTTKYVLNVSSMKFHRTTCNKLPTKNRKDTTQTRSEIISHGYSPCGICDP